eukprot:354554-Chlamydomonas_euryale.AAC.4
MAKASAQGGWAMQYGNIINGNSMYYSGLLRGQPTSPYVVPGMGNPGLQVWLLHRRGGALASGRCDMLLRLGPKGCSGGRLGLSSVQSATSTPIQRPFARPSSHPPLCMFGGCIPPVSRIRCLASCPRRGSTSSTLASNLRLIPSRPPTPVAARSHGSRRNRALGRPPTVPGVLGAPAGGSLGGAMAQPQAYAGRLPPLYAAQLQQAQYAGAPQMQQPQYPGAPQLQQAQNPGAPQPQQGQNPGAQQLQQPQYPGAPQLQQYGGGQQVPPQQPFVQQPQQPQYPGAPQPQQPPSSGAQQTRPPLYADAVQQQYTGAPQLQQLPYAAAAASPVQQPVAGAYAGGNAAPQPTAGSVPSSPLPSPYNSSNLR